MVFSSANITKNTLTIIMAGGKGERLQPITKTKPKPAVPFGGKYKIIDFVLSNVFNSGLRKVYIITQYKAFSLNKHIKESWAKWTGLNEFFDTVSPETKGEAEQWFLGTADAIYQNIELIETSNCDYVAIFGGDHIYKMDISQMIIYHRMNKADITIAALEVPVNEARRFGVLSVDDDFKVKTFVEKPSHPPTIPNRDTCFASMGNYIFNKKNLLSVLKEGKKHHHDLDFGKHVIPMMLNRGDRVFAYNFFDNFIPSMTPNERGYWMDVGTIESYYEANMDLVSVSPKLNLYNYDWPILTNQGNLPPAKTVFDDNGRRGANLDSLVCGGCITSGGTVRKSILGPSSRVNSYSLVENSIVFEGVDIGRHCKIKNAIIDEYVKIPEGTVIGYDHDDDKKRGFTITKSGITVITKENFL